MSKVAEATLKERQTISVCAGHEGSEGSAFEGKRVDFPRVVRQHRSMMSDKDMEEEVVRGLAAPQPPNEGLSPLQRLVNAQGLNQLRGLTPLSVRPASVGSIVQQQASGFPML